MSPLRCWPSECSGDSETGKAFCQSALSAGTVGQLSCLNHNTTNNIHVAVFLSCKCKCVSIL